MSKITINGVEYLTHELCQKAWNYKFGGTRVFLDIPIWHKLIEILTELGVPEDSLPSECNPINIYARIVKDYWDWREFKNIYGLMIKEDCLIYKDIPEWFIMGLPGPEKTNE